MCGVKVQRSPAKRFSDGDECTRPLPAASASSLWSGGPAPGSFHHFPGAGNQQGTGNEIPATRTQGNSN